MAAGLLSYIRDCVERIDRARLRRPRDADDRHWPDVALLQATQGVTQQVDAHATFCIDLDRHEIVAPDAKNIGCLAQRVVAALRDDDREPVMAVVAQRSHHSGAMNAGESITRAQQLVAARP